MILQKSFGQLSVTIIHERIADKNLNDRLCIYLTKAMEDGKVFVLMMFASASGTMIVVICLLFVNTWVVNREKNIGITMAAYAPSMEIIPNPRHVVEVYPVVV